MVAVENYIIPPDQYGFKPNGRMTAAILISCILLPHTDGKLKYVRWLLVDFSKAFYSVDHLALVKNKKLAILQIA